MIVKYNERSFINLTLYMYHILKVNWFNIVLHNHCFHYHANTFKVCRPIKIWHRDHELKCIAQTNRRFLEKNVFLISGIGPYYTTWHLSRFLGGKVFKSYHLVFLRQHIFQRFPYVTRKFRLRSGIEFIIIEYEDMLMNLHYVRKRLYKEKMLLGK